MHYWASDLITPDFAPTDKFLSLKGRLVVGPMEMIEATAHLRRVRQRKLDVINELIAGLKAPEEAGDEDPYGLYGLYSPEGHAGADGDGGNDTETKWRISRAFADLKRLADYERKALSRWFSCFDDGRSRPGATFPSPKG